MYDQVFEFTAYNTETLYGYGTETEANLYLDWLNENREINEYQKGISSLTEGRA
jgi:hypothetical protein